MAAKDKRFELKLGLQVKEVTPEGLKPFFDNVLTYHDLPYDGLVKVEEQLVGVLGQLGDWGVVNAMQMGLSERLSALGMGEKVTALAATMPVQSQSDQPAPADTKRFEVVVDFQVTEDGKGFFGNTLTYHDLPYDGLVGVEAQMTGILNEMSNVGVLQAMQLGLGERLSALGMGEKVAALSAK